MPAATLQAPALLAPSSDGLMTAVAGGSDETAATLFVVHFDTEGKLAMPSHKVTGNFRVRRGAVVELVALAGTQPHAVVGCVAENPLGELEKLPHSVDDLGHHTFVFTANLAGPYRFRLQYRNLERWSSRTALSSPSRVAAAAAAAGGGSCLSPLQTTSASTPLSPRSSTDATAVAVRVEEEELSVADASAAAAVLGHGADNLLAAAAEAAALSPASVIIVEPVLHINKTPLRQESISVQTVLSRCLGPFSRWPRMFRNTSELGYNVVHFTPLQALGESGSCYSIADQLHISEFFLDETSEPALSPRKPRSRTDMNSSSSSNAKEGGAAAAAAAVLRRMTSSDIVGFDELRGVVKFLEEQLGLLSVTDLVLNHTANNSPWLQEHPESGYTLENSPWLRGAYELDCQMQEFSRRLVRGEFASKYGATRFIETEQQLQNVCRAFEEELLRPFDMRAWFQLDSERTLQGWRAAASGGKGSAAGASAPDEEKLVSLCFQEALKQVGVRRGRSIVLGAEWLLRWFWGWQQEEQLRRVLQQVEKQLQAKAAESHAFVMRAVEGHTRWERLECKRGPLTENHWESLSPRYFTPVRCGQQQQEQQELGREEEGTVVALANNGWVMGWDATKDFAAPGALVYLRRELVVWSDCVKLRYGRGPEDAPFLWNHMTEYCKIAARVFHGARLDNCHSTPIHVAQHMLRECRRLRPDFWVFAELFTGSQELDLFFERSLGINALIRETMQTRDPGDLAAHINRYSCSQHRKGLGQLSPLYSLNRICVRDCLQQKEQGKQQQQGGRGRGGGAKQQQQDEDAAFLDAEEEFFSSSSPEDTAGGAEKESNSSSKKTAAGAASQGRSKGKRSPSAAANKRRSPAAAEQQEGADEACWPAAAPAGGASSKKQPQRQQPRGTQQQQLLFEGAGRKDCLMPLRPAACPALLYDCTHDNETPAQKMTAATALPNSVLVAAAGCAVGSTRGYDELVPRTLSVVAETRVYEDYNEGRSGEGELRLCAYDETGRQTRRRTPPSKLQSAQEAGAKQQHKRRDGADDPQQTAAEEEEAEKAEGRAAGAAGGGEAEEQQNDVLPELVLQWRHGGNAVAVRGTWDGWSKDLGCRKREDGVFVAVLRKGVHYAVSTPNSSSSNSSNAGKAAPGEVGQQQQHGGRQLAKAELVHFKFIVDGVWVADSDLPCDRDATGNTNNVLSTDGQNPSVCAAWRKGEEYPGLLRVRGILNKLHVLCGQEGFTEARAEYKAADVVVVVRHHPLTHECIYFIARCAFSPSCSVSDSGLPELELSGRIRAVPLLATLRVPADADATFRPALAKINGLRSELRCYDSLQQFTQDVCFDAQTQTTRLRLRRFPPGSAMVICTAAAYSKAPLPAGLLLQLQQQLLPQEEGALQGQQQSGEDAGEDATMYGPEALRRYCEEDARPVAQQLVLLEGLFTVLPAQLQHVSLCDFSQLLFSCEPEEHARGGGSYDVPGYGPLVYAGLTGVVALLDQVRLLPLEQQQQHPLLANMRGGFWLLRYSIHRLSGVPALEPLAKWLTAAADLLEKYLPIYAWMRPYYVDLVFSRLYAVCCACVLKRMPLTSYLSCGAQHPTAAAAASTTPHAGSLTAAAAPDATLSPPPAARGDEKEGKERAKGKGPGTSKQAVLLHHRSRVSPGDLLLPQLSLATLQFYSYVPSSPLVWNTEKPSIAAGLPFFSSGFMRAWGRDTFIALKGVLLTTGRFDEAKEEILGFARVLRHGLIPNLLDSGNNPRYNARDATWWFCQSVQDYCLLAPEGSAFLKTPVKMKFESHASQVPDLPINNVGDVLHHILLSHAKGIDFREWNAGKQIDEHMRDEGFNIKIFLDPNSGLIFGGNAFNCGTWMDKNGSSVKAKNAGLPATPRDGAAVEIIGLLKSTLRFITRLPEDVFPYKTVVTSSGQELTYKRWNSLLQARFEKYFYIPGRQETGEFFVDEKYINRRGCYKDTYKASAPWADYQLRPNVCVALAVAPELFTPERARSHLDLVEEVLLGPQQLGMKTLDPSDWNYRPDYDNGNDSDDFHVAHGYNYHQGPEWLWPLGYFLRAKLLFFGGGGAGEGLREPPTAEEEEAAAADEAQQQDIRKPAEARSAETHQPRGQAAAGGHKERQNNVVACNVDFREDCLRLLHLHRKHLQTNCWRSLPELTNANGAYCRDSCSAQAWSIGTLLAFLGDLLSVTLTTGDPSDARRILFQEKQTGRE